MTSFAGLRRARTLNLRTDTVRFALLSAAACWVATVAIVSAFYSAGLVKPPELKIDNLPLAFASIVLIAPTVENLGLFGLLALARRLRAPVGLTLALVAAGSGWLHYLAAGWRAVAGAMAYLLFSATWFANTERLGFWGRYRIGWIQHAAFNLPAALALLMLK